MNTHHQLASTGIEGLDDIVRGGLPANRVYLIKGEPGVGKTTLALQFLLEGTSKGETALYITLSETREELTAVASSHGWTVDKLNIYELTARDLQHLGQYTMYQPAEVELQEVMQTLLAEVKRVKPQRVVFDSLSEIRLLAQHPHRYRRQILELKQYFAGSHCTVFLLDDNRAAKDSHLESLAHGVVRLGKESPLYGGAKRRLEVEKLRGVQFRDGFHDYIIQRGGLEVFPRLVASEHDRSELGSALSSGVKELDLLLGGGLDRGTATLIMGPAGSGKSSLGALYATAEVAAGGRAAIYSFDESVATLITRSEGLGMPLKRDLGSHRISVSPMDPADMSPGRFAHDIRQSVETKGTTLVVIDSLTGYLNAMPEERYLVNQLHELLAFLGKRNVVTILISTQHGLIGNAMQSPVDVSYLADGVILLRYFEAQGVIRNAVSVLKKRSGAHERTIREIQLGKGGVHIGPPLKEFQGVLSGVPTYSGPTGPLMRGADAQSR